MATCDPATWLPREQVSDYISRELIPVMVEAFRAQTEKKGFCAIGSVKTNVGHLDTAAGVAGLIKTALALEHKMIPPSLHFEEPNPELNLEDSQF